MFSRYVCWQPEIVQRVMNVEAIQAENHLFLATHNPMVMYRQDLSDAASRVPYDEQQLLKDFLAPSDFVFMTVLGSSGTGKSHLVRWLAARIPASTERRVLLIPKVGTNLRDILQMILEGMEGQRFDEYRSRLQRGAATLNDLQAREALLNSLALHIGPNGHHDLSALSQEQNYLRRKLPGLLYDPYFRGHFLKDEGIIHQLVVHALGRKDTVENREERREFRHTDLPWDALELNRAGEAAREVYSFLLGDEQMQDETVRWLNRHLDEAIAEVLNLGREDLLNLMRDVREALAEKGVELVLLIEDFAKFQGIDRELLEAILARPQQPGRKPLCAIRTALACTSGYFDNLIDTIKTRVSFSVSLDTGLVGERGLVNNEQFHRFVTRYLNAVRTSDEKIKEWAQVGLEDGDPLPSACDTCEHRQTCHASFGQVDEIGLYPFTTTALARMLGRISQGRFNPRAVLDRLLKYVLEYHAKDLQNSAFPNRILHNHFGGRRLSTFVIQQIQQNAPKDAERWEALMDLWDTGSRLTNLGGIQTAFDLKPLENIIDPPVGGGEGGEKRGDKETLPPNLVQQIKDLDRWVNGTALPQSTAQTLRELIFPAIRERIEWDSEILLRGAFVEKTGSKLFVQANINFLNASTRRQVGGIELLLPIVTEQIENTALALQGMLLFTHYGHWDFPQAHDYMVYYARMIESWSRFILEQIRRRPSQSGQAWNPSPAAAELLALGARIHGESTAKIEDCVNALFVTPAETKTGRSTAWKQLAERFRVHYPKLLEILRARIPCTKGVASKFQMIDTSQFVSAVRQVAEDWEPHEVLPDDLRQEFAVLSAAREDFANLLPAALEQESERQLSVYRKLVEQIGDDLLSKDRAWLQVIEQAAVTARDSAVFVGTDFEQLDESLKAMRRIPLAAFSKAMQELEQQKDNARILELLSTDHERTISTSEEFLTRSERFITASLLRAETDVEKLRQGDAAEVSASIDAIGTQLTSLNVLVNQLVGNSCS